MTDYYNMVVNGKTAPPATPSQPPAADTDYYNILMNGPSLTQGQPSPNLSPTANLSPVDDPSKTAGIIDQVGGSMPSKPEDKIAYFAKQRFPNDPNAINRYGVQDNRVFYTADDGKAYFEEAGLPRDAGALDKIKRAPSIVASGAGPSMSMLGGAIGGVASAPVMGGIPGAGAGAALADQARQGIASLLNGKVRYDPVQTATEAGINMLGQGAGKGVVSLLNRNAARDIGKIGTEDAKGMIDALRRKSQEQGVPLTPAEITNLKSLKGQQNTLGDYPASADTMQDFYTKRNTEQVPQAVENIIGKISPAQSAEVGANSLRAGAKATIKAAKGVRQEAASPIYKEAFSEPGVTVETAPIIDGINAKIKVAKGGIKSALIEARKLLQQGVETQDEFGRYSLDFVPDTRLDALHQAKLAIDDMIENKGGTSLGNVAKRELVDVQNQLVSAMKQASPKYGQAMQVFEDASPGVDALINGEIGVLDNAGQMKLTDKARILFESGPEAVAANRKAFEKAGQIDKWNDGLNSYLREAFNKASRQYKTGNTAPGAAFRYAVFGTPKQKAAMQASMAPDQFSAFNDLMEVLEATGRVPQGGSRTAFAQEGMKEMRDEAGKTGRRIGYVTEPWKIGPAIGKWYEELKMGQHADQLAQVITSPEGMAQLKQLRQLSPKSEKAVMIVNRLLFGAGIKGAMPDAPDTVPAEMQQNPQMGQ